MSFPNFMFLKTHTYKPTFASAVHCMLSKKFLAVLPTSSKWTSTSGTRRQNTT